MKSPFTGGEASCRAEDSSMTYRKETYHFVKHFYECDESGERFTTGEQDELSLNQVYNQYRVKYGIPFPDEIKAIRLSYGLSAAKMSAILGLGDNQYRLYEGGDMPSETNGKLLASIRNPRIFLAFVENSVHQFTQKEYETIFSKVKTVKAENEGVKNLVFANYGRSHSNGFAPQSLERLQTLMQFFIADEDGVYSTKMNKLLFFTDFLSYKRRGMAISGLAYNAEKFGPVPVRWDRVYSLMDKIEIYTNVYPNGSYGQVLRSAESPDLGVFSDEEVEIIKEVAAKFKNSKASEISELSHQEKGWERAIASEDRLVDFDDAFSLKAL